MQRRATGLLAFTLAISVLAQSSFGQSGAAVPTLRTNARLVVVDVVVTDKNQNAIHGLKASDFSLQESGTPQTIKSFEEHSAASETPAQPAPVLPPGVFTNFTPLPTNGPLNVLLIDRLNTPMEDQLRLQTQLANYLRTAQPGTRTAIFGLNGRLLLLQGFTQDPAILKAAVQKQNGKTSVLLPTNQTNLSDMVAQTEASAPSAVGAEAIANLQLFETQLASDQQQLRVLHTLDSLNLLARYLAAFPGRKNLIWFSGSFPINILPDLLTPAGAGNSAADPFFANASAEREFLETTSLLSIGQVAVYPIDARGLITSTVLTAATDDSTGRSVRQGPAAFVKDSNTFSQKTYDERTTMMDLANQTGGRAFVNSNDLSRSIAEAIANGANYYTLAYTPNDPNWNGKFRSIKVALEQKGYTLSYRRGYFANDPYAPSKDAKPSVASSSGTAPSASTAEVSAMRSALMRGAPMPTQIIFVNRTLPAGTATEDALAPGNSAKNLKGPYRRYIVDLSISPQTIDFTPAPDGTHSAALEIVTFLYNSGNNLVNSATTKINATLKPDVYARVMQGGIPLRQQISVPASGDFYLRTAVHDFTNNRIGAVEVPLASVKNLPPAPQLGPPAGK